jgi:cytochrome P450
VKRFFSTFFHDQLAPSTDADTVVDFLSEPLIDDPNPILQRLRKHTGMVDVKGGGYALLRHEDVAAALVNPDLTNVPSRFSALRAANATAVAAADFARHAIAFRDGDKHVDVRKACIEAFSACKPPPFEALCGLAQKHLVAQDHQQTSDLIEDVATPYVLDVMCQWFGLPRVDGPRLAIWSASILELFAPITERARLQQINQDILDFRTYLRSMNTQEDTPSLLRALIKADMRSDDALDNAILIFIDGIENVRYGIGNIAMTLRNSDGTLPSDNFDRDDLRVLAQEALRLNGPATVIARVAARETEVLGQPLKQGTPAFLVLASANRDETVFHDADTFDASRNLGPALTFGAGYHSCLGARAAIDVMAAMLHEMCDLRTHIETSFEDAEFYSRFGHRWPRQVRINIAAA